MSSHPPCLNIPTLVLFSPQFHSGNSSRYHTKPKLNRPLIFMNLNLPSSSAFTASYRRRGYRGHCPIVVLQSSSSSVVSIFFSLTQVNSHVCNPAANTWPMARVIHLSMNQGLRLSGPKNTSVTCMPLQMPYPLSRTSTVSRSRKVIPNVRRISSTRHSVDTLSNQRRAGASL